MRRLRLMGVLSARLSDVGMSGEPIGVQNDVPPARRRPLSALTIACWIALLTGLLQGLILIVRREIFGQFIWASTHVVWMSPLSYLFFLALVAIALQVAQQRMQGRDLTQLCVTVIGFLAIVSLLVVLFGGGMHPAARVLLAGGLAVATGRVVERHRVAFAAVMRSSLLVMLLAVALLAGGLILQNVLTKRATFAALRSAHPGKPNVLLVVMDCARADHLGFYGYQRNTTPFLNRLAMQGVVFEAAYATAPWTLPSHASLFTGHWAHELSASWLTPLDDRYPTLADALTDQGYRTGAITANHYYTTSETGLDRGFVHFEGRPVSLKQVALSSIPGQWANRLLTGHDSDEPVSDRQRAAEITDKAIEWVLSEPADQGHPFFLFLNYFDAHHPAEASQEVKRAFSGVRPRIDAYDASIAEIDKQLEVLLEELGRRGKLENTIVIITSDHGETFGEKGLRGHGHSLYVPVLRVPLLIVEPHGRFAGKRVEFAVSLRDIPATVMDLAALDGAVFPGASLARYLEGSGARGDPVMSAVWSGELNLPDRQPASRGRMFSVIWKDMHYIRNGDGVEEFYDLQRDSAETRNLVDTGRAEPDLWSFRLYLERQVGDAPATSRHGR